MRAKILASVPTQITTLQLPSTYLTRGFPTIHLQIQKPLLSTKYRRPWKQFLLKNQTEKSLMDANRSESKTIPQASGYPSKSDETPPLFSGSV
jgi:hypothetical protein